MWEKYSQIWYWNCTMWLNHQIWETYKWTAKCNKRIVKCDVGTAQCDDGINKYEKK